MNLLKITGAQAADARAMLNLSQAKVSRETGISRSYLSQFENGSRKLSNSELSSLREYYEEAGYVFDDTAGETRERVKSETARIQDEIAHAVEDDSNISVSAVELSDLLANLEDMLTIQDKANSRPDKSSTVEDFILEQGNPTVFLTLMADFESANEVLSSYLSMDDKGELKKPSFLGSRDPRAHKVITLMALQYARYITMKSGIAPFKFNGGENIPVMSKGHDAEHLSNEVERLIAVETEVDEHLSAA